MAMRWGAGPVFEFECLTTSRRWQVYAARALLVAGLLAGLAVVWWSQVVGHRFATIHELSRVGHAFFVAIMGVELVLVLMVAPAAAAGAVCHDRSRGGLTHLLVTDLSDTEIVLGKLAARLATVLGIVACALPVLVLCTLLGGVDPDAIVWGSIVVAGTAVLGVSVAMMFSVWASKAHEALTATYAAWSIWLLAMLVVEVFAPSKGAVGLFLEQTNPFWLIFATRPANVALPQCVRFLAGSLALSAVLAALATLRLRAVTLRRAGRASTRPARRFGRSRPSAARKAERLLDRQPILWRERHRRQPSGWNRAIWRLFAAISVIFTVLSFADHDIAPGTNGFQVSIGLLLVSVSAATALAEERVQGSLDVILASPLSTRQIVIGKWLGAFRPVPWLAIMPGLLMLGVGAPRQELSVALLSAILMGGLVLAYGAAIVSLGLLVATWQRRLGRAVALNVTAYLAATVVWPTVLLSSDSGHPEEDFIAYGASPFFGAFFPPILMDARFFSHEFRWMPRCLLLLTLLATVATLILLLTLATFDTCLGRVAARRRAPGSREPNAPATRSTRDPGSRLP